MKIIQKCTESAIVPIWLVVMVVLASSANW